MSDAMAEDSVRACRCLLIGGRICDGAATSTLAVTAEGAARRAPGCASKKPSGLSKKPTEETGITGQSSSRGMWVWPKVYQRTRSRSARSRSAFVHFGRPCPPGFWLGYSPAGIPLLGSIGRDPEVAGQETRPLQQRGGRPGVRQDVLAGAEPIADGRPSSFFRDGLTTRQNRAESGLVLRRAADSFGSGVASAKKALPCGFSGPGGHAPRVDLLDGVGLAVDVEVEPGVEEVLMIRGVQPRRDLGPVSGRLARLQGRVFTIPVSLTSIWIVPSW